MGDRDALLGASVRKDLNQGDIVCEQGELLTQILFVEAGIISSVIPMADGTTVEAYMVGNEGVVGTESSFIRARSLNRLTVQATGHARAVDAETFRRQVSASESLRTALADYEWSLKAELEQSTACNAVHIMEARFAKWLLRCHDRTDGDTMWLTQEFLAAMLGGQRTTVNEAAQQLQRRGAIRYSRGKITVTDRHALEAAACECYSAVMAMRDGRSDAELAEAWRSPA